MLIYEVGLRFSYIVELLEKEIWCLCLYKLFEFLSMDAWSWCAHRDVIIVRVRALFFTYLV